MVKISSPSSASPAVTHYRQIVQGQLFWAISGDVDNWEELMIRTDLVAPNGDTYSLRVDGTMFSFSDEQVVYPVPEGKRVSLQIS